ncbi:MAG: trypsin-like peptidase domain-containing protein [Candidatus Hydrogenedentes bacterium]|nr:trypsin-like peptidase domain-containing protein [Candidatus Hydrogenedentota bacterium]
MRTCLMLLAVLAGASAAAEFADYVYVPPVKAEIDAVSSAVVQTWLAQPGPRYVFDTFAGQNDALKASNADGPPLCVADGFALDLDEAALFDEAIDDNGARVFTVTITSLDAVAVRLLADISQLQDGDELWVVAPGAARAFGPFTAADAAGGGRWLNTIFGDTAVLAVRTPYDTPPPLTVLGLSHFFVDAAKGVLYPCPVEADCVSDTVFQEISTGIGMLYIPYKGYKQAQCSGALLHNPDTAENEGLVLTANHCFPSGSVNAAGIEVVWDYRAAACDGSGVQDPDTAPRSTGQEVLARDDVYDGAFFSVQSVPVGARGRAWLGWDTREPAFNDPVAGCHHPMGAPMKSCFGTVTEVNVSTFLGESQTEVHWDEGITEQGSSGSPLMFSTLNYRVFGMLSNGPAHDCYNPPQNRDNFSSFRHFFPEIQCYLLAGRECAEGPDRHGWCPAKAAFRGNPEALAALRAFRDKALAPTGIGRSLVAAYYRNAPRLAALVTASPRARGLFMASARPFVALGRMME